MDDPQSLKEAKCLARQIVLKLGGMQALKRRLQAGDHYVDASDLGLNLDTDVGLAIARAHLRPDSEAVVKKWYQQTEEDFVFADEVLPMYCPLVDIVKVAAMLDVNTTQRRSI